MAEKSSSDSDKKYLLSLLEAHGNAFLSSFGTSSSLTKSTESAKQLEQEPARKRRRTADEDDDEDASGVSQEDAQWTGFDSDTSNELEEDDTDPDADHSYDDMDDDNGEDFEDYDDDFRSDQPAKKKQQPEVVTFSESSSSSRSASTSTSMPMSRLQAKTFMSSKVSKLRQEVTESEQKDGDEGEDHDNERTNLQNDKLLHKLVHTQLLSGSLNNAEGLNLTPAQRRKALEGRVLELAAGAKLGKGESVVRKEERKKAAKRVRMGLERKVEERRRKALEEAKDLGNYHRSIKHLYDSSDSDKRQRERRKRERGLKLGVGKFAGGVLKLSRDEIASVQDHGQGGRGSGGKSSRGRPTKGSRRR